MQWTVSFLACKVIPDLVAENRIYLPHTHTKTLNGIKIDWVRDSPPKQTMNQTNKQTKVLFHIYLMPLITPSEQIYGFLLNIIWFYFIIGMMLNYLCLFVCVMERNVSLIATNRFTAKKKRNRNFSSSLSPLFHTPSSFFLLHKRNSQLLSFSRCIYQLSACVCVCLCICKCVLFYIQQ